MSISVFLVDPEGTLLLYNEPAEAVLGRRFGDTVEASSSDRWTSRARPMILYTFCAVFFVDKGLLPTLFWLLQIFHSAAIPLPPSVLDASVITTAIAGVLGLGVVTSRGLEKIQGVAR